MNDSRRPYMELPPAKRPRMEEKRIDNENVNNQNDQSDFFQTMPSDVIQNCIKHFIDRTSNRALSSAVCIACARELAASEGHTISVNEVPNHHLLIPNEPHPAHVLTNDLLLHTAAITYSNGPRGFICNECISSLQKNRVPRFALANEMWIGNVPFELAVLTLPEWVLIARHFPAAHIVKLFPMGNGSQASNSGLRGNVSTYRLDTNEISDMISDNIFPRPCKILASVIGVTIVGPKNVPEKTMPGFLHARRYRVHKALTWLRDHNLLWSNIIISDQRLLQIGADGVPEEILMGTRYSDDIELLEQERSGYVPEEEEPETKEDEIGYDAGGVIGIDENMQTDDMSNVEQPTVIPLQALGVIDVGATDLEENEVLAHALANTSNAEISTGYAVKRGSTFVNEYARKDDDGLLTAGGPDDPNHMMGAFPVLWPYGKGGIEIKRPLLVPYQAHVQYLLQYADKRFRTDIHFIFQAFGVLQKRQVCSSACLQVSKTSFLRNQKAFRSLTPKDLMTASVEESRKTPFSNPIIRALRYQLSAVRTKVMGTDESRIKIRAQIKGMTIIKGPPSLWITINPSDTGDPIAQVFAGEEIDLDNFSRTSGPNSEERMRTIAADPYAAAKFFHFIIAALIEEMFGIKAYKPGCHVQRTYGIFGKVASYIGTVEAQGRGTLHLHIILWLCGSLSSTSMKHALQSEAFRSKVADYIKANIRADLDGLTGSQIQKLPKTTCVSHSRPCDPSEHNYLQKAHDTEVALAKTVQLHKCSKNTCLVIKKNRIQCKCRAPFPLSDRDHIEEDGTWGPKRIFAFLNNWNPPMMQCMRSNHDIKLITNGFETIAIAFYISMYVAKHQANSSNASALLANKIAFHRASERYNSDITLLNKRLLQRCANTLSREQEFSGPEVISYLMGWGDRYISHYFVPIFWNDVVSTIKNSFPDMNFKSHKKYTDHITSSESNDVVNKDAIMDDFEIPDIETVQLTVINGTVEMQNQLQQYVDRGPELEDMCLLDFFLDTYEGTFCTPAESGLGRKPNARIPYKPHTNHGNKCRIVRTDGHETMPTFIGDWFPRNNVDELTDFFHASILALLSPWTVIDDIKRGKHSFADAFDDFLRSASTRTIDIMDNIQYQHECYDSAIKKRVDEQTHTESQHVIDIVPDDFFPHSQTDIDVDTEDDQPNLPVTDVQFTQRDVELQLASEFSQDDKLFADVALNIAMDHGFFGEEKMPTTWKPIAETASNEQMLNFRTLDKMVQSVTKNVPENEHQLDTNDDTDCFPLSDTDPQVQILPDMIPELPHVIALTEDQRRAHDIVTNYLRAHLNGQNPPQILMLVIGQGGSGKSQLLNAITATFKALNVPHLFAKAAMSGVAASLVGGTTLHWFGGLPTRAIPQSDIWPDNPSKKIRDQRSCNLVPPLWLSIDEASMCTTDLLTLLSQVAGKSRVGIGNADATIPLGGLNVMLIADFHQFPPVRHEKSALYCPPSTRKTSIIGRAIYLQFTTVVQLRSQWRITDKTWMDILQRARNGDCSETDLAEIQKLVITDPDCDLPDFNTAPWDKALLVTPRNCVRYTWNRACLRRHSMRSQNRLYIFDAEDTVGNHRRSPTMEERVTIAGMKPEATENLTHRIELAIGMLVMVTFNIATEADLANGSRGVIEDIVLDPRERVEMADLDDEGVVWLQYPPAMVLFRPFHFEFQPFPGLDPGLIPIFPSEVHFTIHTHENPSSRVHRRQYPMTAAYAFTDHKAQGQTIEFVIVDIGRVKRFPVTPFAAYVALSRSRGRQSIRLLRDFDKNIFTSHPSEDLRVEDHRLNELDRETKEKFEAGFYNF